MAGKTILVKLGLIMTFLATSAMALSPIGKIEVLNKVEVSKNEVFMSDLVKPDSLPPDWHQHMASIYVGEAPEPGEVKYVQVKLLRDYLRQIIQGSGQDPERVDMIIPPEIIITRRSVTVPSEEIERVFTEHILKNAPWKAENIVISQVRYGGLPVVPSGQRSYEVITDPKEKFLGNVVATLNISVDGKKVKSLRVAGLVDLYEEVFYSTKVIPKGEIVKEDDIQLKRAKITDDPKNYSNNTLDIVGKKALRDIYPEEPLKLSDLDNPVVIEKGDTVKLVFTRPGMLISAKGEAKDSGRIGDKIRVMNLSSKKVIQGRIKDKETVIVTE